MGDSISDSHFRPFPGALDSIALRCWAVASPQDLQRRRANAYSVFSTTGFPQGA